MVHNRRMDGRKKWHIEVVAPPKTKVCELCHSWYWLRHVWVCTHLITCHSCPSLDIHCFGVKLFANSDLCFFMLIFLPTFSKIDIYQKKIAHQKSNVNKKQWLTNIWIHLLLLPIKYQKEHRQSKEENQSCCLYNRMYKTQTNILKLKKPYGPFFMDGVQLSHDYRATTRRQFTFHHSVPRNSWYSIDWPWKDERLSWLWSHTEVLNSGPLDWESSTLTTRPLLLYLGQTGDQLNDHFNRHRSDIRCYTDNCELSKHFHSNDCDFEIGLKISIIKKING